MIGGSCCGRPPQTFIEASQSSRSACSYLIIRVPVTGIHAGPSPRMRAWASHEAESPM